MTTHATVTIEHRMRRECIMRTVVQIGMLTDGLFPRFTDRLVAFGTGMVRPEYRIDGGRWRRMGRVSCDRVIDGELECYVAAPDEGDRS